MADQCSSLRKRELAFWATPEVWRAITDAWYGQTNRTLEADRQAAEALMGDIDEAVTEALRP